MLDIGRREFITLLWGGGGVAARGAGGAANSARQVFPLRDIVLTSGAQL
jgi:hypothetical protein